MPARLLANRLLETINTAMILFLYFIVIALAALLITILQLRQQVGPNFDVLVEKISLTSEVENLRRTVAADHASSDATEEMHIKTERLDQIEQKFGKDPKFDELSAKFEGLRPFLLPRPIRAFAFMPPDFLVLFLATLMGAVGGSLSVVRKFVEGGERPDLIDYYLRPALGFISAIAVFVLFKAGQLVISTNTGASDTLNPFLIAFLGVISGLVARQAVGRIERAGSSFFQSGSGDPALYARPDLLRLVAGLEPEEQETLLTLLHTDRPTLTTWISEISEVPANVADILAAFFRQSKRDLFSHEPRASMDEASPG